MPCKTVAFVGRSGSGKTTLVTRLIPELKRMGLRVATLKHTHHRESFDRSNKDSWKHRQAGAEQVMLMSETELALFKSVATPPEIDEIARKWFSEFDLLVVEGFKHAPVLKVEVYRPENPKPPLYNDPAFSVDALVTNAPPPFPVPHFALDDVQGLVQWLSGRLGLGVH